MNQLSKLVPKTLRTKLLICFVLVSALPLLSISLIAYYRTKSFAIQETGGALQEKAAQTLDKIYRNLFERYGDVQAFAFNSKALGSRDEVTEVLNFYTQTYGCYDLMIVADPDGMIVAANTVDHRGQPVSSDRLVGTSVRGQEWFERAVHGGIEAGASFFGDAEQDPTVAKVIENPGLSLNFSAPIYNADGKVARVWSNRASFDRIVGQILDDVRAGDSTDHSNRVQLLNRAGILLYADGESVDLKHSLTNRSLEYPEQIVAGKLGYSFHRDTTSGQALISGYATSEGALGFPGYGWGCVVQKDSDQAAAVATSLLRILAALGLAATAAVTGVAFWLASRISRPIAEVAQALQRFSEGELSHRVRVQSNDEVGALSESLNRTLVEISTALQVEQTDWAELRVRSQVINTSNLITESDLQGNILHGNDKFCEVSQYSREQAIGQPHHLIRHPDMSAETYRELWQTIQRGQIFRGTLKNRRKDGSAYFVDAVVAPILGKNGQPRKYLGVQYDITHSESERINARGIMSAINAAFAYIEFEPSGKVLTANDHFLQTLGYRLDEIAGQHHRIFVDSQTANSDAYAQMWEDLRAGRSRGDVFPRVGRDGRRIWIQAVYAPVVDDVGRVIKVVKIATDVTKAEDGHLRLRANVDEILSVVQAASEGDLTREVTVSGDDPVGQLGRGLQTFFSTLRGSIAMIGENATALAGASEELSAVSSQMSSNAQQTASQANVASTATEVVHANVKTVTVGVDELNAAIREIAKNATDAARVSQQAVTIAQQTNSTISKLGDSSSESGKVVKVITSIAEQTNLLALNATIEAARAGEAGKGFSVVADEVKELAKESAKATEDISQKIAAIQADTSGAIQAIQQIGEVINQINDISNTIASAVEEQTATTHEMGRNATEAARGSAEIAANIVSVAGATQSTMEGATNSMQAAGELSRMAGDLQRLVGQFKYHVENGSGTRTGYVGFDLPSVSGAPQWS